MSLGKNNVENNVFYSYFIRTSTDKKLMKCLRIKLELVFEILMYQEDTFAFLCISFSH